jgi:hypothetical protein
MRPFSFFVVLAIVGAVTAWASGWNPFPPKDYEECIESAAKSAKSNEALAILVSSCSSKFVGRRNVRGGYTYYDDRQNSTFNIAGPNPTPEEWALIENRYQKYLADVAAAEGTRRRQDAERQRLQDEAQQQAALAQAEEAREQQQAQAEQAQYFERRRQFALSRIAVTSVHIEAISHGAIYVLTLS